VGNEIRTVIILDSELPVGQASNAAAALAYSCGATGREIVGEAPVDSDGDHHAGLFMEGLPILAAKSGQISAVRDADAGDPYVLLIEFPAIAQTTTEYEEFRTMVANTTLTSCATSGSCCTARTRWSEG
jgi:hypothetical protein